MSKVAVGCASVDTLERRQLARRVGDVVPILTRFRPKRADELIGGSIFWIVKHRLVARQTILGFDVRASDRKILVQLDPELVRVRPQAKRAHQGWRYLDPADAPADLDGDDDGLAALPGLLSARLAALALI